MSEELHKEGYKRETRKSYQLYLNELMEGKAEPDSSTCEDSNDDSSIRRSKRTPIPKRNFKLIDDYDSPSKKKVKGSEEKVTKSAKKIGRKSIEENAEPLEDIKATLPVLDTDDNSEDKEDFIDATPRKSARAPKPKTFNDSVSFSYAKKSSAFKESTIKPTEDVFISTSEAVKQRRKSSIAAKGEEPTSKGSPRKRTSKETVVKTITKADHSPGKKAKRKASMGETAPTDTKTGKKPRKSSENVLIRSDEINAEKKSRKSTEKTPKGSPRKSRKHITEKKKLKSKKTNQKSDLHENAEEIGIKQEYTSQEEEDSSPSKQYVYESFVTSRSNVSSPNSDEESSPLESMPTAALSVNNRDTTATKSSKKKKKEKKLLISFKKKPLGKTTDKLQKATQQSEASLKSGNTFEQRVGVNRTDETKEKLSALVGEHVAGTQQQTEKEEKQKKEKRKSKKKLDSKNQKVVDVKTFTVDDTAVSKVKKKKIYKKRNGQKVLIRIIKNHCNKNGDIVKTETVMVDNVPVDDLEEEKHGIKSPDVSQEIVETQVDVCDDNVAENITYDENNDTTLDELTTIDMKKEELTDEEFLLGKGTPEDEVKSKKTKGNSETTQRASGRKKLSKKKMFSRPANKNVTVGGKVVGKTTKGMKKTGTAFLQESSTTTPVSDYDNPVTPVSDTHGRTDVVDATQHSTEPKNAYNLFCRKYRPLILQQHPKADFSELSRRLAALWNAASPSEKEEHRARFQDLQQQTRTRLNKLNRTSPTLWSDSEMRFIKQAITVEKENFQIPKYNVKRLEPVDFAAHLQVLGDSLKVIAGALEKQSSMTVHGAMSVLLDSVLCSFAPLIGMTSFIPEMDCISPQQQADILDNIAYILPGL